MNVSRPHPIDDLSIQDYMYSCVTALPVIGFGSTRTVYAYDDKMVLKHEIPSYHQNMAEWHLWRAVQNTPMAAWFCPCNSVSASGRWLWMQRAEPTATVPKRIPKWLKEYDLTPQNFGILNGKTVLVDYGYENLDLSLMRKSL
jgi:hypothetical protein